MSEKQKITVQTLTEKLTKVLQVAKQYSVILFIVFVATLYGFVAFQISKLTNAEPSQDAVSSQVKAAQVPNINKAVVQQLQSLQDNSVSVHTLFNDARKSPFQE